MPTFDDAISFLLDFARSPRSDGYTSYGYEVYLPNVVHFFRREVLQSRDHGFLADDQQGVALSPVFLDAAWELCRRGILRPGLRRIGGQSSADGASGLGFSLTASGRERLASAAGIPFLVTEPTRFAQMVSRFRDRLGDGFFQRAQEAARCHFSSAYLASCAMSGASAESILLRVAIAKTSSETQVLNAYRSASGRSRVENLIVGQAVGPVASQFRGMMELLKYWRDPAAHGGLSDISEFEAYEALARLLRLAHFTDDHWSDLTSSPSTQERT